MRHKHPKLSLDAQKLDDKTWYYERPSGLEFIRYRKDGSGTMPEHFIIPWKMVSTSVKRYRAQARSFGRKPY